MTHNMRKGSNDPEHAREDRLLTACEEEGTVTHPMRRRADDPQHAIRDTQTQTQTQTRTHTDTGVSLFC